MKLIYKITIVLIALALSVDSRRIKTNKSKRRDSGSYAEGLVTSYGMLLTVNQEDITVPNLTYFPATVESTTGDLKFGLKIQTDEKVPPTVAKFFIQESTNKNTFYLPYRFMNKAVTFYSTYVRTSYFYFEEVQNDAGDKAQMRLYVPAGYMSNYITTEESNTFVENINKKRTSIINTINEAKRDIAVSASEYSNNMKLLSEASNTKKLEEAKEKLERVSKEVEELEKQEFESNEEVNRLKAEVQAQLDQIKEHEKQIIDLETQVRVNKETLDVLSKADVVKDVERKTQEYLEKIDTYLQEVISKAPEMKDDLTKKVADAKKTVKGVGRR